jgi:hypothetical protein
MATAIDEPELYDTLRKLGFDLVSSYSPDRHYFCVRLTSSLDQQLGRAQ